MREKMKCTGLSKGCHQEMVNEHIWKKMSTPGWLNNEALRALAGEKSMQETQQ